MSAGARLAAFGGALAAAFILAFSVGVVTGGAGKDARPVTVTSVPAGHDMGGSLGNGG